MGRNAYTVKYSMQYGEELKKIDVIASSKADATRTALYHIWKANDRWPWKLRVDSVTYQNGNVRYFKQEATR